MYDAQCTTNQSGHTKAGARVQSEHGIADAHNVELASAMGRSRGSRLKT